MPEIIELTGQLQGERKTLRAGKESCKSGLK